MENMDARIMNQTQQKGNSEIDSKDMDVITQVKLNHQLEEWKILNEYINKMDLGYSQAVVIIVSVFSILTAVLAGNNNYGIIVVPVGIEAVCAYLSYQFRITAILRGHLAALEKKMNHEIGDETHLWNSVLVETYMAHNNSINSLMLVPMFFAIFIITIYCFCLTVSFMPHIPYGKIWLALYWIVILVVAIIIIKPFFQNEIIRYDTENEGEVIGRYREYIKTRGDNRKKQKFQYEEETSKKDNEPSKERLVQVLSIALINIVLSVGVFSALYCFWWKPNAIDMNLPGLEAYYAATFGDGIFLSMFLASGFFFLLQNCLILDKGQNKMPILSVKAFLLGTLVGVCVQVSWLVSDSTRLNWTLDRVHHFNLAGYYHAVYFVVMLGLVLSIIGRTMQIYLKNKTIKSKSAVTVMWISLMGYWFMHYLDDQSDADSNRILLIVTVCICIIVFMGCSIKLWKHTVKIQVINIGVIVIFAISMTVVCIVIANNPEYNHDVLKLLNSINTWLR